jgi:hypothetical protein
MLAERPARDAASLGPTADQALLGFHACWLQHAGDESDGVGRTILDVVSSVARARLHWPR